MNNLTLQTVFVGVIDGNAPLCICTKEDDRYKFYLHVEKQDNRIILTPQELNDLLLEYHPGMVNDPKPFLKSKGIEL